MSDNEKRGLVESHRRKVQQPDLRGSGMSLCRVRCRGRCRVIFANPGVEPVLGVTALESVGIMVDPTNKTLKRLPAIPLK
jgi:hypothetical protein